MTYPIEFKYRFELLVPLADNEGRPFPWPRIERVGTALMQRQFNQLEIYLAVTELLWL